MDNLSIARILGEIADLLEIRSENPFKIRAYRNAADIVANHPHDLGTLDANQLREIPGIGKDLAARIREIADTGDAQFHQELLAEFPPTILDLLHLQGVGPKTVAILYKELGVKTLDELEGAAKDGRVRALKGMGPKKESLILKAIDERKQHSGRHLLPDTHDAATLIVEYLREQAPAAQIEAVGSLRRGAESCGDIDILASGADSSLMDGSSNTSWSNACSGKARRRAASESAAGSRPISASSHRTAGGPPCSISPARRRTTSCCATGPSAAA